MSRNRIAVSEKPLFITIIVAVIITGTLTITSLRHTGVTNPTSILCTFINSQPQTQSQSQSQSQTHLKQIPTADVIIYYTTTRSTAQLTFSEIKLTADVIQTLTPCNLLIFGISHESLMWSSLNPRGTTLFLENDVTLIHKFLTDAPSLRVHHVTYETQLSEADYLLSSYKTSPKCLPPHVFLKGNTWCKLALSKLPEEVYSREWDAIIVDGPKGYYGEAPGRMGAIFSAAVMARNREKAGDTHVFVHDVDRKVEKEYAQEFLCRNYLVNAENKLWYFKIPRVGKDSVTFC